MIFVGIDDTDTPDSRGTNQLAKSLVRTVLRDRRCARIVRHQLLLDDRVPYTSKNGSASLRLDAPGASPDELYRVLEDAMRREFIAGSDPGLCVAAAVPEAIRAFGRRCQQTVVTRAEAEALAGEHGVRLAGLGGTNDGVIGALAAVGLAAGGEDGRIIYLPGVAEEWGGPQPVTELAACGVRVVAHATGEPVASGVVDVGKKLRPNLRGGRAVLFVERSSGTGSACDWTALKLP